MGSLNGKGARPYYGGARASGYNVPFVEGDKQGLHRHKSSQ
jgi:hypothetical protein